MNDPICEQIRRVKGNQPGAREALFSAAYGELRKLARSRLYGSGNNAPLGATELVHESYLRFTDIGPLAGESRGAFFAYASQVMRSVIVDEVRRGRADRRGGRAEHVAFDTQLSESMPSGEDEMIWVHEALELLAQDEPRLAQIVEMRYFGGYSEIEIAAALQLNERTVRRDWNKARLLLSTLLTH